MIITLSQVGAFFLILARLAGLITNAPFFNRKQVFAMSKVAIIFWMGSLMIFVVPLPKTLPDSAMIYFFALVTEFMVGALLGVVADLILIAVEFGGAIMDTQAGLAVSALLNPTTGRTSTLISLMLEWTSIILFLQVDGHHMVLAAVNKSFTLLPIASPINFADAGLYFAELGTQLFAVALQLAAPILLVVFLIDFSFGMLSRVAPQVNVFQLGFQLKPTISLFIFLAIVPSILNSVVRLITMISEHTMKILFLLQTH